MIKYSCPFPGREEYWIGLPDKFLGKHAHKRDVAVELCKEYDSPTLTQFGVAMALLDDWYLPGLSGNPEAWDFREIDLDIIAWVTSTTLNEYSKCWMIPKN